MEENHELPAELNVLSQGIIGCAIEVHRELGPGLLESPYEEALTHELQLAGHAVQRQVPVSVWYKGKELLGQRLDIVVDSRVIIELKAVERVLDVHAAQLVGYLRAGGYPLGLLMNFNVTRLHHGVTRRVNSRALRPSRDQTESFSASSASFSPRPLRTSSLP